MKHVYTYMRPSRSNRFHTLELDVNWDDDPAFVAEECAEDFHRKHGDEETHWPMEFLVTLTDGRQVRCLVERETRPEFIGTVIEDSPAQVSENDRT